MFKTVPCRQVKTISKYTQYRHAHSVTLIAIFQLYLA